MSAEQAEVADLAERLRQRDERERMMGARLRQAFLCLEPLIKDLPAAEIYLLAPQAVDSWRVMRDEDPDSYLVYVNAVRTKCGNNVAILLLNRVGPPGVRSGAAGPIRAIPLAELMDLPLPDYTIKPILPRRGLGTIYGASGSGKTFEVIDMVMAPATNRAWRRKYRVKQCGVVYLVAEGAGSFPTRIKAYCEVNKVDINDVKLEVITARVDLRNPGAQLNELITAIRDAAERIGTIGILVIDTLTRTMPGGSDSKAEDMSAYLENCTRLADAVDAFVLIVHHCGKDQAKGSRGHSSLPAAVDVEIEVRRDAEGNGVAEITKSRDAADGLQFGFRLRVVELGRDADGDSVTSCVIEHGDAAPERSQRQRLSGVAKVALQALGEAISQSGTVMANTSSIPGGVRAITLAQWRERFELRYGAEEGGGQRGADAVRRAFNRAREALLKASAIGISNPYCWSAKRAL
jgi:KaiC/GvpD/RAD55 family RecA-like ATPase